ncbi:hypothetical protein N0V82_008023 [Gnomoniopsis sp. IMI 355080]|nr:hypothetical protein N0V82_008023 [Gnomoniopsis sp. IMI 355080]
MSVMTRFVALKITTARLSNTAAINRESSLYQKLASSQTSSKVTLSSECFNKLLDSFQISGPNGVHTAFVFEPLGPHLETALLFTPEFSHGETLDKDDKLWKYMPENRRFPKNLGKRILRNVLHGLQYFHAHGVVHGDLHQGNILVTIRDLVCTADKIREVQQRPEDGKALKRRDGKLDLWAPPYQLGPAGLLQYSSTELDPYVKITDIGGAFLVDEPPPGEIVTPSENRAPEIHLGLSSFLGPGIDIWSFGCLAFWIITGHYLFLPGQLVGSEEAVKDINLIQFSEVIGSLPETMFRAWERGESYFTQDRATRRSEMLADGEDGTWDFLETDDYDEIDGHSENRAEEDEEGSRRMCTRRDNVDLEEADDHKDDAGSDMSYSWLSGSIATDEEVPLISMAPCRSLEERFADKKPPDVGEVEAQEIVHLLRWIFQYDTATRPTAEEILNHSWFQTEGQDVAL